MTDQKQPPLAFHGSRRFTSWLKDAKVSLTLTTYQVVKLFLLGLQPDGRLSVFERTFERPMGLGVGQGRLWMSSIHQLWRFEDFLDTEETCDGYDALYVPIIGHTTGDLDIHDIHEDADGQAIFVATRFNCLATLAERGSFRELWRPPFINRLAAEDRCHLNGLAMKDGQPAYHGLMCSRVGAKSATTAVLCWRSQQVRSWPKVSRCPIPRDFIEALCGCCRQELG
jgi:uncharacterized protein (TIGR03032 family)